MKVGEFLNDRDKSGFSTEQLNLEINCCFSPELIFETEEGAEVSAVRCVSCDKIICVEEIS